MSLYCFKIAFEDFLLCMVPFSGCNRSDGGINATQSTYSASH